MLLQQSIECVSVVYTCITYFVMHLEESDIMSGRNISYSRLWFL